MRGIERVLQILDMQFNTEARFEVTVENHRNLGIHDRGTGQPSLDGVEDRFRLDAGLGGQNKGFRDGRNVEGNDDLVGKFGDVARADITDEDNGRPHFFENRFDRFKGFFVSANHDGKRTVDGFGFAARNRGIEHSDALGLGCGADFLRGRRSDRTHIDEDGARPGAFEYAVFTHHGFFDMRRIGQHGNNDVALCSHVLI